jgi:hypothetical protein
VSGLPDDPAELFGADALTDARALRRAYARLIKQHSPEGDPVGFAHVHARFEAVKARQAAAEVGVVESGRAGTAEGGDGAAAGPAPHRRRSGSH